MTLFISKALPCLYSKAYTGTVFRLRQAVNPLVVHPPGGVAMDTGGPEGTFINIGF